MLEVYFRPQKVSNTGHSPFGVTVRIADREAPPRRPGGVPRRNTMNGVPRGAQHICSWREQPSDLVRVVKQGTVEIAIG
jgi:hypothetical protein